MPKVTPQSVKVEAVELVRSGQAGVREAAAEVGVGRSSVSRWVQSEGIVVPNQPAAVALNRERWAAKRAELAQGFVALADKALAKAGEAMDNNEGANAKAYAVTAAIATDKHLLLTGEATSRHERTSSPEEQRLRVAELLALLESRRPPPLPG